MTSEVTQDSEFSALQDKFAAALEAELSQSYDCTRVWSAWGYGTMGEDDFEPVINRIDQIATELAKTALYHEAHRLAHRGGEVVADQTPINMNAIVLQCEAASDRDKMWHRRWKALRALNYHNTHFADQDGNWTLADFIAYAGEVCGFQPPEGDEA